MALRLYFHTAQGSADEVTDAMARIFVWLRYSSSRQLTWQRNYNTQPRILGEAQARLTNAIAQVLPCSLNSIIILYQDVQAACAIGIPSISQTCGGAKRVDAVAICSATMSQYCALT